MIEVISTRKLWSSDLAEEFRKDAQKNNSRIRKQTGTIESNAKPHPGLYSVDGSHSNPPSLVPLGEGGRQLLIGQASNCLEDVIGLGDELRS